jgi:hypothetical protein
MERKQACEITMLSVFLSDPDPDPNRTWYYYVIVGHHVYNDIKYANHLTKDNFTSEFIIES